MRPSRAAERMTLEEWYDLPDEIEGELVDGYLVEEEVPGVLHEVIVSWLAEVFGPWARRCGAIIIDPKPRTIEIFALGPDGRYASAFSESAGRHDDIPGCPGLSLDLDDLWAQVARLA